MNTKVAILHSEFYSSDLKDKIYEYLFKFPIFIEKVKNCRKEIILKPNVTGCHNREKGRTTDPYLLSMLIDILRDISNSKILIADSSVIGVDTKKAFTETGIIDIAQQKNVSIIDLKNENYIDIPVEHPLAIKRIMISKPIYYAEILINLPKMKTTPASPVSLGIKNLKGVISDESKLLFHHINLQKCLVDLFSIIKPDFSIVDGFIGSSLGQPIKCGTFILGEDNIAVDKITSEYMRIKIPDNSHIFLAGKRNLGSIDINNIEVIGEQPYISSIPFRITSSIGDKLCIKDKIKVISCNSCSGCIGILEKTINDLEKDFIIDKWIGEITLLSGSFQRNYYNNDPIKIIIGNCAINSLIGVNNMESVPGCPPTINEILEKITLMQSLKRK